MPGLTTIREAQQLIERQLPTSALRVLNGEILVEAECVRAEALMMLDRLHEATEILRRVLSQVHGDWMAYAGRLWAEVQYAQGNVDEGILMAQRAARCAQSADLRAAGLAWAGIGYGRKYCWKLAEEVMEEARRTDPDAVGGRHNVSTLAAQARLYLIMDRRLEARKIYEQIALLKSPRAQMVSCWGQAYAAWLLGSFEQAEKLAREALKISSEVVQPLFVLADIALAREDVDLYAQVVAETEQRSPKAEVLSLWKPELNALSRRRLSKGGGLARENLKHGVRRRLNVFPTAIQRRDYCAPCTIELVLRFWEGGLDYSNDQIAQAVKYSSGGSPIYRIREFFHLVGFQTVRCFANVEQLKLLVDAGYPTIIQEHYSESSHVSVVIGYDDEREVIEMQDPITHIIRAVHWQDLQRLRDHFGDGALIAFPRGQRHERTLARLGLLDDPALISLDQCGLAMDEGRLEQATELAERALSRRPGLGLAWISRLAVENARCQQMESGNLVGVGLSGMAQYFTAAEKKDLARSRSKFQILLKEARRQMPEAPFVFAFEGLMAFGEGDISKALTAYRRALKLDPQDAGIYASLAACYFALRDMEKAVEMARGALKINPAHPGANAWMARALAHQSDSSAEHYGRCAAELAGEWWMTHLALGEAFLAVEDNNPLGGVLAARREVEMALALADGQGEALLLRAQLQARADQPTLAVSQLEEILASRKPLFPVTVYEARKLFSLLLLSVDRLDEAATQIEQLLRDFPEDAWGSFQQALVIASSMLRAVPALDEPALADLIALFEKAVRLNKGAYPVVNEYLDYLSRLVGDEAKVMLAASRIAAEYPQQKGLAFLEGRWLARAGRADLGSRKLVELFDDPEVLHTVEDLQEAMQIVALGMGAREGENVLRKLRIGSNRFTAHDLWRAWGLALAQLPEEMTGEKDVNMVRVRAEHWLQQALRQNDQDSLVALRLGMLTMEKSQQEAYLRRALLLAPRWSYARAVLANFLLAEGRSYEALQYTAGHDEEGIEIALVHASALLHLGWYEQAAARFKRVFQGMEERDPDVMADMWNSQLNAGDLQEAYQTVRAGMRYFPGELAWRLRLARTFVRMARLEEAEKVLKNLEINAESEYLALEIDYDLAAARQHWEIALQVTEKMCESGLVDGVPRRLRAWVELRDINSIQAWLEFGNHSPQTWAACAWMVTLAENGLSRTEQAHLCLALADRALAADEENFYARFARAYALINSGEERQGLAEIETLLWQYPLQHQSYSSLAMSRAAEGNLREASEFAERAVEYGAGDLFSFAVRGMVNFLQGDNGAALADLQLAWKRADAYQRRRGFVFWWLLAILSGEDLEQVEDWRQKAVEASHTSANRRIIERINEFLERRED